MKIDRISLLGYGKLNSLNIELQNGLNVVYGPNEAGKSTLQSYIKAMLFGQRKGKSNGWSEKERFKPWQGNTYGGTLEYSLNTNEKYRVWRDFDSGQTKIFDSRLNDITNSFETSRNQGILFAWEHLGVDEELFAATCFVSQSSTKFDEQGQTAISDRIGTIVETGSERASYTLAKKLLEKVLTEDIGTERAIQKPLNKTKERIENLKEQKRIAEAKLERIYGLESRLKELKEISQKIETEAEQIKTSIKNLVTQERSDKLERSTQQLENLKLELQHKMNELDGLNAEIPIGTAIFDSEIAESLSEINKKIEHITKRRYFFAMAASALSVLGLGTIIAMQKYWIFGATICAVGLITLLLSKKEKIDEMKREKEDILSAAKVDNIEQYFSKKREISFAVEKREMIEKAIDLIKSQLAVFNEDIFYNNETLKPYDITEGFNVSLGEERSSEKLQENYTLKNKKISELGLKTKELETEMKILSDETEQFPAIEEELESLVDEKAKLEENQQCIRMALENMQLCSEEIKNEVMPYMIKQTGNLAKALTGRYIEIGFGAEKNSMSVSSQEGRIVPAQYMSGGTEDQLYLALRLSMSNILSEKGETLPIILDEAFSQYDDNRFKAAINLIKEFYLNKQIIIFTCKESEVFEINKEIPEAKLISL